MRYLYLTIFFISCLNAFAQDFNMIQKGNPVGGQITDMEISSTGTMFAAAIGGGLYRSTDNGSTWSVIPATSGESFLDIDIDANGIVYAVTAYGLWISTDNTGTTYNTNNAVSIALNNYAEIGYVKKSGTSPTSPLYIMSTWGYGRGKQTVIRSTNNGQTWTEVYSVTDPDRWLHGIAVNSSGNVFLLQNQVGIFKSTSGAGSFTLANTGMSAGSMNLNQYSSDVNSSLVFVGGDLYALFYDNIYKSTNNAVGWTDVTPAGYSGSNGGSISSLGSTVYVYAKVYPDQKLFTYSGGSWSNVNTSTVLLYPSKLVARTSGDFFLASEKGILRSSAGTSWATSMTGINSLGTGGYYYNGLLEFDDNLFVMSNPIVKSTDTGETWNSLGSTGTYTNSIVVTSDGTFFSPYYSEAQGAAISTDGGQNWSFLATPADVIQTFVANGTDVYGIGNNGIYKTTNSGGSWPKLTITGLPTLAVSAPQNTFISNNYLYIGEYHTVTSTIKYYKINLSTLVATEIAPPAALATSNYSAASLWEHNGTLIFASSQYAANFSVYTSTDDGASWTPASIPSLSDPAFYVMPNGYWVLASGTAVRLSRDKGANWLGTSITMTEAPTGALLDHEGYLNLFFRYRGLLKSDKPLAWPASPTNLKITGSTFNAARLEWDDNADNEDQYWIERSTGDNLHYDTIASVTPSNQDLKVASFIQTSLNPQTTYYYRVSASNAAGSSVNYSNEISITTPAKCATTVPNNHIWTLATENHSGQGVKIGLVNLLLGRLDDWTFGSQIIVGDSYGPPYTVLSDGFASVIENCGSVYLAINQTASIAPDGNGTWDDATKTLKLKWKINEAIVPAEIAPPFSEVSDLIMQSTYPTPGTPATILFVGAYDDTGMGIGWATPVPFATETAVERSASAGGPFTEVGRISPPDLYFVDRTTGVTDGTTYYYRIKGYNPNTPSGGAAGPVSNGVAFSKPYFAGVETQNGLPVASRLSTTWSDVNNDGYDDMFYVTTGGESPTIMMNQKNGTFLYKTFISQPGLDLAQAKMADFNNDGNVDLLAFNEDAGVNDLEVYSGDGTGAFTKMPTAFNAFTSYTTVEDFDLDGKLDIAVPTGHYDASSNTFTYTYSVWKNNGNFLFAKTIELFSNEQSLAYNLHWIDYDNDGDRDYYMNGNFDGYTRGYRLMVNNGDGTYTKKTLPVWDTFSGSDISAAEWVDIDNDQDLDLMVHHNNGSGDRELFRNDGGGNFTNLTSSAVIDNYSASTFTWFDAENDGDQDLIYNCITIGTPSGIYLNNGSGTFTRRIGEAVTNWHYGRNVFVTSDYDHDGSEDVFVGTNDSRGRFFKGNNVAPSNTWISVKLRGVKSNRSGIGSMIQVTAGATTQSKMVNTIVGSVFGGHSSLVKHFGTLAATTVDVQVTWPDGKKQTLRGVSTNQFIEIIEDTDGPAPTAYLPAKDAVGVNASTQVSVTLNEDYTVSPGELYIHISKAGTELYKVLASSGTVSGSKVTYTLPGNLPPLAELQVSVDAGAFTDKYENGSAAIAQGDWKFTTASGPVVTAFSPANNATGISATTALEITFDKAFVVVNGKHIVITDASSTTIATLDVANGTVTGTKFSIHPTTALPSNVVLTVSVDQGAFQDDATNQNDNAAISGTSWVFTTGDTEAPTLSDVALDNLKVLQKGASVSGSLKATDNVGVTSVKLYYRKVAEKNFTGTKDFTFNTDHWEISISSDIADDMGLDFYAEASDAAGNKTDTDKSHTILQLNDTQSTLTIPQGGSKNDWRIIAMPWDLADTQIQSIFVALGGAGKQTWRMLNYDGTNGDRWTEYPNFTVMDRGKGYFINSKTSNVVTLKSPSAPDYSQSNLFQASLKKGWNQIGNPYTVPLNWSSVQTYNNNPDIGPLYTFASGSYSKSTSTLQPEQGGFVFMNNPATVLFAFDGQTTGGRVASEDLYGPLDSDNWKVDFKFNAGDKTSDFAGFGMNGNAAASYDRYDGFNPPRFMDFLEVNFPHPEHFMHRFSLDVIPSAKNAEWKFAVDTNLDGMATLTWDNSLFGSNNVELYLYDEDKQTPINMKEATTYSFVANASKNFRIYYGENALSKIKPVKLMLGSAYPNPTSNGSTIPFSIPEKAGGSKIGVSLDVFDVTGRKVATVVSGEYEPGFYSTQWAPTEGLSNGIYFYRLLAGKETLTGKVVLKK